MKCIKFRNDCIEITLDHEDVISYFSDACKKWFCTDMSQPPPHPFIILDDIIIRIAKEFSGAFRYDAYTKKFRNTQEHYFSQELWTGAEIFKDKAISQLHAHNHAYVIDTKGLNSLDFRTRGEFFKPCHAHWNTDVFNYDYKRLKTKEKHQISFHNFNSSSGKQWVEEELKSVKENCPCKEAYLIPHTSRFTSVLYYACKVCGKFYVCDCFDASEKDWKPHFETMIKRNDNLRSVKSIGLIYKKNICHICRGLVPPPKFMNKMYGSFFMARYAPWVYKEAFLDSGKSQAYNSDKEVLRNAENKLREKLGIHKIGEKWINETILFNTIRGIIGDKYEVIHHARPAFLGLQEFDVFVPELNIAFEYDGIQHHRPVDYFGGDIAYEKTKLRDNQKNKKAKDAGVLLVRITENYSEQKIVAALEKQMKRLEK